MDETEESADNQPSTSGSTNDNNPPATEDPAGTEDLAGTEDSARIEDSAGAEDSSKEPKDEDTQSVKSKSPSPGIQSVDDVPWRDPTSPIKPNVPERLENPPASEDVQPERKGQEDPPKPSDSAGAISIPPELKYEAMKSALEETVSSLPQVAAKTLFRYLDIHKPRQSDDVKKRPQLTPEFIETVSNQAKELEKQIKITSRRITESKREQVHLAEQIENLKNKFIKDQEVTLISELLDKVPSSRDLERIQKLNEISLEWKQQQRNIEKVQTRIEALNKVMANLDVIIQESGAVNKKRRVIFSTDLKGTCDTHTSPTPPPWSGFKEGFIKDDLAVPDETNGAPKDVNKTGNQNSDEDEDNLLSDNNGTQ